MPDLVRIQALSKSYHTDGYETPVLRDVSCSLAPGTVNFIVGPSGSGKSTFLNIIGLLDRPTKGQLQIMGEDIAALSANDAADFRSRHIGYIFQSFNLIPVLNVAENIEFPLLRHALTRQERREKVSSLLQQVGLEGFEKRRIGQISGGQRQRVAIARALVASPSLVVADEPTANLDSATTQTIMQLLHTLNKQLGTTLVICTHNESLITPGSRVLRMIDGRLHQEGGVQ